MSLRVLDIKRVYYSIVSHIFVGISIQINLILQMRNIYNIEIR